MSRGLTRAVIGAGIVMSLLGWGAGQVSKMTLHTIRPGTIAKGSVSRPMPQFTIHFSVEVRP